VGRLSKRLDAERHHGLTSQRTASSSSMFWAAHSY
jgi:hypothetical protein